MHISTASARDAGSSASASLISVNPSAPVSRFQACRAQAATTFPCISVSPFALRDSVLRHLVRHRIEYAARLRDHHDQRHEQFAPEVIRVPGVFTSALGATTLPAPNCASVAR
ncbi:hypothetical protein BJ969_000642 [Saccharopolyspora gloriosae]|uniref:Uncharacterized protein n=1 Tax=Saccharopolyspora gloriosae TaxID=455344 RepID=A0A840N7D5_9PSEU|nr:hypothetical protein [Saccharopolyspora gloriosae]